MIRLKDIRKKITKSRFVTYLIGWFACRYVHFVAKTTKWERRNFGNFYDTLDKYGSVIFVAWHGRMPVIAYFWDKRKDLKALVSPHRDGQMIVGFLKYFGIGHISGSSNENAKSAAVSLMRELSKGTTIAIIPDGPRGPNMTMSMSPVYYAMKTGKPVVSVTYAIEDSFIVEKSWDRMLIPKPFKRGICAVAEPVFVPADASKEDLEMYRKKIEDNLNELTWQIDKELNLPPIPKGTVPKSKRATSQAKKEKTSC